MTAHKWIRQTLTISGLRFDDPKLSEQVVPAYFSPTRLLAIHRSLNYPGIGWTITHVRSGLVICEPFATLLRAKEVTLLLDSRQWEFTDISHLPISVRRKLHNQIKPYRRGDNSK